MRPILAGMIFITLAVAAVSHDQIAATAPPGPTPLVPSLDKGVVEGRTYKNPSIGVELVPAPGLEFQAPELTGPPDVAPRMVYVVAAGEAKILVPREVMSFSADALAYYPEYRRSTDTYMQTMVQGNQKKTGLEPLEGSSETELGGVVFARKDLEKGFSHEAMLVRACDDWALLLVFAGSNRDTVDKLIAGTELKLDLERSGCGPNSISQTRPHLVGGNVSAPRGTYTPDPEYSEEARREKIEGTCVLWLIVSADGSPRDIKVAQSLGHGLDEKAVEAVRRWKFKPGLKDGKPVATMINVKVDFRPR